MSILIDSIIVFLLLTPSIIILLGILTVVSIKKDSYGLKMKYTYVMFTAIVMLTTGLLITKVICNDIVPAITLSLVVGFIVDTVYFDKKVKEHRLKILSSDPKGETPAEEHA